MLEHSCKVYRYWTLISNSILVLLFLCDMCLCCCISAYICKVKRCDQQPQRNRKRRSHVKMTYGYSGVHVTRSLVLYVYFVDRCCPFVLFLLDIVLSVLRFTDSDYLPLVSSNSSCRSLFVPLSFFLLVIVLSVLRFTDSDYLPLVSSNSSYVCNLYCSITYDQIQC
jgi:hypothetical protein